MEAGTHRPRWWKSFVWGAGAVLLIGSPEDLFVSRPVYRTLMPGKLIAESAVIVIARKGKPFITTTDWPVSAASPFRAVTYRFEVIETLHVRSDLMVRAGETLAASPSGQWLRFEEYRRRKLLGRTTSYAGPPVRAFGPARL